MSEKKPNVASKELDKMQSQFENYEAQVQALTLDRMNMAPKLEVEEQTKLSKREIAKKPDVYLKPRRSIRSQEKFNEAFRGEYEYAKEYVHIIAENYEIIGETMEFWSKPFAGMPAEEWAVPSNKPVWVPRYVAEQISRCRYHRLKTVDAPTGPTEQGVTPFGTMIADNIINRLDAKPVRDTRTVFMGASSF